MTIEQTHQADTDAGTGRPDKHDYATVSTDTWAVHGGNRTDDTTGAIRSPIVMANSYRLPDDPTAVDDSDPDVLVYTRESGANQLGLQDEVGPPGARGSDRRLRHRHGRAARRVLHPAQPRRPRIVSNVVYMRMWGLFDSVFRPSSASRSTSSTSPISKRYGPLCVRIPG